MPKKYMDLETLKYVLYDIHKLEDLLTRERFKEHDLESLDLFIDSVKEFSDRDLYPYFKEMDQTPAYYKDGTVIVHEQVKTVMHKSGEMGIIAACLIMKTAVYKFRFLLYKPHLILWMLQIINYRGTQV